MQNLLLSSTIFDRGLKSKEKSQKKKRKKNIWKRKFVLITQCTISQKQIHSIRIQMTPTNAEFYGEFDELRLKIEIERKIAKEKKQRRHLQVKICRNYRKFDNFTRENSLN